jgi:hypothetical protein
MKIKPNAKRSQAGGPRRKIKPLAQMPHAPVLRNEASALSAPVRSSEFKVQSYEVIMRRIDPLPFAVFAPLREVSGSRASNYQTKPMRFEGQDRINRMQMRFLPNEPNQLSRWFHAGRTEVRAPMKITKRTQPLMNRRFQDLRSQIDGRSTVTEGRCGFLPNEPILEEVK